MNNWDFLIQADGEQTWTSLSDRAPVTEGKYRLMARTGKAHAEVEICIAYYSQSGMIPSKKRYSRLTDAEGALMIFPLFSLTVGRWQIYCLPNMMEQLCGANWKQTLTVEVGAKSTVTAAIAHSAIEEKPATSINLETPIPLAIPITQEINDQGVEITTVNLDESLRDVVLENMEPNEQSVEILSFIEEADQTDGNLQDFRNNEKLDLEGSNEDSNEPEIDFENLIEQATFLEKTGLELPDFDDFENEEISLEIFAKRDRPWESFEELPEMGLSLDDLENNLNQLVRSLAPTQNAIAGFPTQENVPLESIDSIPSISSPEESSPELIAESVIENGIDAIEKDETVIVPLENIDLAPVAEGEIVANPEDHALVPTNLQIKTYVVELIDLENNSAFTLDIEVAEVENGVYANIDLPQPSKMRKMLYKTNFFGHRKILPPKLYPHRSANSIQRPIQLAKFKPCPLSA